MNKEQNIWGNCTDPARHNPNEYRYLVHGFNPSASYGLAMLSAQNTINKNNQYGDQSINLIEYPEKLADRVSMSMSLIDQSHTVTWGGEELLLKLP